MVMNGFLIEHGYENMVTKLSLDKRTLHSIILFERTFSQSTVNESNRLPVECVRVTRRMIIL